MIIFRHPRVDCIAPAIAGGLIAAGGTLLGGIIGSKSNKSTNQSNIYAQQLADQAAMGRQRAATQASRHDATIAYRRQVEQANIDRKLQREFAQHGIGWKADDARAAGLDPLVAMGSQTFYSPVGRAVQAPQSSAASAGSGSRSYPTDYSWLGQLGQDLGRATMKALTQEQIAHELTIKKLEEENLHLDNDWKQMRNMQLNRELLNMRSQSAVTFPSDHAQQISGQGDSVDVVPNKVIRHAEGHTAGVHAMRQYRLGAPDDDGNIPVYSAIEQEAGDAMDADLPTKGRYNAREWSRVVRSWGGWVPKHKPKISKKGYHLRWNRAFGQWMLVPNTSNLKIRRRYGDPRDKGTKRQRYRIVK